MSDLLRLCPAVVVGNYIAVTAVDSGRFIPSKADVGNGWSAEDGIAYSPVLQSIETLPEGCCCRDCGPYDEWYVFRSRPGPLGNLCQDNVFTSEIVPGTVFAFVNFVGFTLTDPEMGAVTELFWRQMEWVQPHAYIGDGSQQLVFVTRDIELFVYVSEAVATGGAIS